MKPIFFFIFFALFLSLFNAVAVHRKKHKHHKYTLDVFVKLYNGFDGKSKNPRGSKYYDGQTPLVDKTITIDLANPEKAFSKFNIYDKVTELFFKNIPNNACLQNKDKITITAAARHYIYSYCFKDMKSILYEKMDTLGKIQAKDADQSTLIIPTDFDALKAKLQIEAKTEEKNCKNENDYVVKHEMLEIRAKCPTISKTEPDQYVHFLIDRDSRAGFPDIWNTQVRVFYLGCLSENLIDFHQPETDLAEDKRINLNGQGQAKPNYLLSNFFSEVETFLTNYPKYNFFYNCQHFATNFFNQITGQNLTYTSPETKPNNFYVGNFKHLKSKVMKIDDDDLQTLIDR